MAKLFRQRKGQSAIEYLTTYGWMLLVIAIVGGAIFTTVQNSSQIQSTSGLSNADVQISDFGISNDNLVVEFRAASSDQIENLDVTMVQQDSDADPVTGSPVNTNGDTIPVGDTVEWEFTGINDSPNTNTFDVNIQYDSGGLSNLSLNGSLTTRATADTS